MLVYGPSLKDRYCGGGGMVGVDLSMPYVKGSPGKVLVPDLFVALSAEERDERWYYKLWEEPAPDFVLEDLSPSNWRRDAVDKRELYRRLGVREYWRPARGSATTRKRAAASGWWAIGCARAETSALRPTTPGACQARCWDWSCA